jgi:DNA polymerase-3 subunit alpha
MGNKNYVCYHLHTEDSLLDSCTNHKLYSDKAKELGQTAIGFSEHGNCYNWIEKKEYCESLGLKYIHGIEIYLTENLEPKVRDNYHTILIAKDYEGVKTINSLFSLSTDDAHFYYKPRLSFDEFKNISSEHVIRISACLASPLNKLRDESLIQYYDYLEVQPHINSEVQKEYNLWLCDMAQKYHKPLIAGTDTHSINQYKAECRSVLQTAKKIEFTNEDEFDLTYKSYEELCNMFKTQGVLSEQTYLEAIENTNVMAASIEEFKLDKTFKYAKCYEDDELELKRRCNERYKDKIARGVIKPNKQYIENVREEFRVFKKIGMLGFMLFMSDLVSWCWQNGIPIGFCRGSCGGSTIAYLIDIIDVDPVVWHTVFSRFANENRTELGDIDIDISPTQRELVYKHIIDTYGVDYTGYILAIGTISDKGTIDEIGRALQTRWERSDKGYLKLVSYYENKGQKPVIDNEFIPYYDEKRKAELLRKYIDDKSPFCLNRIAQIKDEYDQNPEGTKKKYPDLFYYFDGLLNTAISQSMHPAGIIVSPITLQDNYGMFWSDGKRILQINMEECHEVSLNKYDLLGLKNVEIIKDTCMFAGIPYPKSYQINWEDQAVWKDMLTSPAGIFQFEGKYAFDMLKQFVPSKINHLSLVNAALRPSGASYRDRLMAHEINKNPSPIIDDLLKDNNGFLVFQEDTIAFLQKICGLSGGDADNVRRAIGRKQKDRLDAALPQILEGYCSKSDKPRAEAEKEAKAFLQIIEDSANYQFGFNHSTGYSMIGYTCAFLRYYYPTEFIAAYLNNANNDDDIQMGTQLAEFKHIPILPPKFRHSKDVYVPDAKEKKIYKGLSSIKFLSSDIASQLYEMRDMEFDSFVDFLKVSPLNSKQLYILTVLDFFSEFGDVGKLLTIIDIYNTYSGKKLLKKETCTIPRETVLQFATETEKQYRVTDSAALVSYLCENAKPKEFTLSERLASELEYLGYISFKDSSKRFWGYVIDVPSTKFSPRVSVYDISTGQQKIIKCYKNAFAEQPLSKGMVIIYATESKQKSRMNPETKKFEKINGEYEDWFRFWTIKENPYA